MHRVLIACLILLLLVCSLTVTPPVIAQSNKSRWQEVALNGIEPPAPGVRTQLEWSGWGGGGDPCANGLKGYFIANTAFTPPVSSRDFAIHISCVPDPSQPVKIAFY